MFFAELHSDRALQRSKRKEGVNGRHMLDTSQQNFAGAPCASPLKPTPTQKAKSAEKPRKTLPADRSKAHHKAATANLGLVLNAMVTEGGSLPGDKSSDEAAVLKLALRYHWASGCLEEHQGQFTDALAHFQRCLELCHHCEGSCSGPSGDGDKQLSSGQALPAAVPVPMASVRILQLASANVETAEYREANTDHGAGDVIGIAMDVCSDASQSQAEVDLDPMDIDRRGKHLRADTDGLDQGPLLELRLANCQENLLISSQTVQSKLEGLEVLKLLANARKLMDDGHAADVVKRLEPLAGLGGPLEGLSCLYHNPRALLQALSLLQVCTTSWFVMLEIIFVVSTWTRYHYALTLMNKLITMGLIYRVPLSAIDQW